MDLMTGLGLIMKLIVYLLLAVATVHTAVLGYHWFTYGTKRHMSVVALTTIIIGYTALLACMAFIAFIYV